MPPKDQESQARIADLWAQLEAQLVELPAQKREEFLSEIRAHLDATVFARRAEGLTEEAAWRYALEAFGDPRQIGRALWEQWASSGQLESEGTPLPKLALIRKFALPLAACLGLYLVLTQTNLMAHTPLLALLLVFLFAFGIYRFRRNGGQWTPMNIVGYVFIALYNGWLLVDMQWGQHWRNTTFFGHPVQTWTTATMVLFCAVFLLFYKRNMTKRPWQFASRYKQNPVAAEQEYKLGPIMGLVAGASMGCIGMISMGLQFGLAPALWGCSGLILVAVIVGFWLHK